MGHCDQLPQRELSRVFTGFHGPGLWTVAKGGAADCKRQAGQAGEAGEAGEAGVTPGAGDRDDRPSDDPWFVLAAGADPASVSAMSLPHTLVTLHPYFQAHPGRQEEIDALLPAFVDQTRSEPGCLFYEFTTLGDRVFCREGYAGAAAVLAHLDNVGTLLGRLLGMADLVRLELHGPAAEIDQLREPLAHLNPEFFVRACGIER